MRSLTNEEQEKLSALTEKSVALTLIEPTATGLKKSIMDATGPVRNYLKNQAVHNFDLQLQGPNHKVMIEAVLVDEWKTTPSRCSLYRPVTKKGDPRIWFTGLSHFAAANDILALFTFDAKIYVVNLTQLPIRQLLNSPLNSPLKDLAEAINVRESSVANELLAKLRIIARGGPIAAEVDADTGVGRTLETALGIDINSSKQPDYKGIELKSFRAKKGNRKNLFAQVADWNLSKFKSSSEILDAFGYWREEDFKLYCTVSAITRNSQGLMFRIDTDINQLLEGSDQKRIGDFAIWELSKLHERLLEKHSETFWISTESTIVEGKEHFLYKSVEHTRKPIVSQFDILLEQGTITMDHLIKRNAKGRVIEKGPLFKIKPNCLDQLFPPSKQYDLLN